MSAPDMSGLMERLFSGADLSPEEHDQLRTAMAEDPELAAAYEEWSATEHAVLGDDLAFEAAIERLVPQAQAAVAEPPSAPVIPLFSRARTTWAAVTMATAAAAAAAFLMVGKPGVDPQLPSYRLEVRGGEQAVLGSADAGRPELSETSELTLIARPSAAATDAKVKAFWRQGDRILPFGGRWEQSDEGAFLASGSAVSLAPGLSGAVELVVVIYSTEPAPTPETLDTPDSGWQLLRTEVRLGAPVP